MADIGDEYIESDFLEEVTVEEEHAQGARLQLAEGSSHDNNEYPKETQEQQDYSVKKMEEVEGHIEEEEVMGQIIQGEDGEFYVVMEDDGTGEDVELDDNPNNVQMQMTADGEQVVVFQSAPADPMATEKRSRSARAVLQDTENGTVEVIQFMDEHDDDEEHGGDDQGEMAVGAMQTAEAGDEHIMHHGGLMEPMPGMAAKLRRTRVYGTCRCSECGQSFVNTARLERHLAVHQVFGSYLCPLCGKTYKYEYNLFYHWRRTCRDLNDLLTLDDRKNMDVNTLRSLVDEVAQKKAEYGPIEIGISRSVLFQSGPLARLEMPANPLGRRGTTCRACGIVVHQLHLQHHIALHRGVAGGQPDERSSVGGFYCDLCGLMFRQHFNLIKHWRTSCAEIQANLPDDVELTLDDSQLKTMVMDLLKRASTNDSALEAEALRLKSAKAESSMFSSDQRRMAPNDHIDVVGGGGVGGRGGADMDHMDDDDDEHLLPGARRERERDEAEARRDRADYDDRGGYTHEEPGAVFADDFEDDEVLMMGDEAIGAASGANRAKWNMNAGPIQCQECFRTFANTGRLERHMAGFHASYGSHHCALCGNRFKYDYNLLYHYRKSCPYTKQFIDRDVRDQMDAASLRKLVRSLAQKEIRLQPQTRPVMRLPKAQTAQNNDAVIRREMMRPVLANMPSALTQPRRGMQGKSCPICSVMFYSPAAIERHVNIVHGVDYQVYEDDVSARDNEAFYDDLGDSRAVERGGASGGRSTVDKGRAAGGGEGKGGRGGHRELVDDEEADDEPPPTLEIQQPGEEPRLEVVQAVEAEMREEGGDEARSSRINASMMSEVDEMDAQRVQEMYERGEIRDGDIIYVQGGGGRQVEYTVNGGDLLEDITHQTSVSARPTSTVGYGTARRLRPPQHEEEQDDSRNRGRHSSITSSIRANVPGLGGGGGGHSSRKRPREIEDSSIWDEDLLEDVLDDGPSTSRATSAASGRQRGRGPPITRRM